MTNPTFIFFLTLISFSYTFPSFISISIWVGDIMITTDHDLKMLVPSNSVFYDVMRNAARISPDYYNFEAVEDFPAHPGHFVTSIGGLEMNTTSNHYWMLYVMYVKPDKTRRPTDELLSPVGVDFLKTGKKKHYLWWYKFVRPT